MNSETFVGNLVFPPTRRSPEGAANTRTTFRLAVSDKDSKGKEKTHFLDFVAFGSFAENLLALERGTRMVIFARISSYTKEVEIDGEVTNQTIISFIAVDGGPSVKWATAKVKKNPFTPNGQDADSSDESGEDEPAERPKRRTRAAETSDGSDQDTEEPREAAPGRTRRSRPEESEDEPRERTRRVREDSPDEEERPRRTRRTRTDD